MSASEICILKMLRVVSSIAVGVFSAAPTFGQTYEVKDRNGISIATVSEVKIFRYSSILKRDIAEFQCTVKNISGEDLTALWSLRAIVHRKDGSTGEFVFNVGVCDACTFSTFLKDATANPTQQLTNGTYTPETFESVEFAFLDTWQSPQDGRLAAEGGTKGR